MSYSVNHASKQSNLRSDEQLFSIGSTAELYQIGHPYLKDINSGIKSFAITSTGYLASQQKSILAIATYIKQTTDFNVAIVSSNLEHSYFKDLVQNSSPSTIDVNESETVEFTNFFNHFHFFTIEHILRNPHKNIEAIFKNYQVILWDFPLFSSIKQNLTYYSPLIKSVESLSIVANQGDSKEQTREEIRNFFQSHDINIKGFEIEAGREQTKPKPWWRKMIR